LPISWNRGHREGQDALLALELVAATPKIWSDRAYAGAASQLGS
jgi:hypothetical protein